MAQFLAAIPLAFAAAAPAAAPAGGAAAGTAAAGTAAAGTAAAGTAAAGTAAAGTAAATTIGTGGSLGIGLGAGATTAGTAAASAPVIGAGVGALTPQAAGAALAAGKAVGAAAGALGTGIKVAGPLISAGNAIMQGQAQSAALKMAAKQEAEQVRNQQRLYQDRIRQVLSLNTADVAGRGLVGGGSGAALMAANLRGGQIDIGFAGRQGSMTQSLYQQARRRASMRGFASAGSSLFDLGTDIASGKVF